ncbi:dTDP-4-dehydrorhamnose reductase [Halioxenophilus sp. WMMB6]|uniref:dTDP-4-dehydrorhamnose reductase n=1 Tax=Halioxenophilus sp. WMMB6 TaxID=3073815 RepID=UPI00295E8377|nr:dTDP-4-dehydrorhamnose reductase [Halioxenophilus sp. WMMB6]
MKILVFGHRGQVGSDLYQQLLDSHHEVIGVDRSQVDFGQPAAVAAAIATHQPELVINACAYTAVDKAETEQIIADAVNHLGVAAMAEACQALNIPTIHLSTDYVYAGDATSPYREDAATAPLGSYGKTKLAGDQALAEKNPQHIILRTSWVFGEQGNNFVKTMLRLGESRDELSVVADQQGKPTYAGDIVTAILAFVQAYEQARTLPWGVYHCASEGETTWHAFALAIFQSALDCGLLPRSPTVHAIPTSGYPTPAPRPTYSVLNTDKLTQFLGHPLPHWQVGLNKLLSHLKAEA